MAVAITKEHRAQAKKERKALFQVFIDSKYLSREDIQAIGYPFIGASISGACDVGRAKELLDLINRWLTENKQK